MISLLRCAALFMLTVLLLQAAEGTSFNPSSSYLARIRANQSFDWTGNVALFAGVSKVLADEWQGAEFQPNLGVMLDFGKKGWLGNIAVDYRSASESGTSTFGLPLDGEINELDIGMRIHIDDPVLNWKAYVGGGVAFIEDELRTGNVTESGSEVGFWLNAGLYYRLRQQWNIGIDLRHSALIRRLEDNEQLTPDNLTYGLMIGYHW